MNLCFEYSAGTQFIYSIGVGTMGAPGAGAPLCFLIVTELDSILYTLIILPLPIDL